MMSVAVAVRWSRGFSAMKKRPVLAVCALPVLPMADPNAATSGSAPTTSPSLTIMRDISCGEMSCADSAKPVTRPVSWVGKEALGNDHEKIDAEGHGGEEHEQRQELVPEHDVERAPIEAEHAVEHRLDRLVDAAMRNRFVVQEPRAKHRRQRQRYEGGNGDCRRDGDGEFAEQPADDAAHQQQRNEHGDQRQADRHHGEADLARAGEGGFQRRNAVLDVAVDVLHHDDGVVDDEADRDGQRHQRKIVEAESEQVHGRGGAEQRERHDDARDQRHAQIAQEQQDHQHHEDDRQPERELDVVDRSADGLGAVGQDVDGHVRRDHRLKPRQRLLDAVDGLDDVGAGLLGDDQQDRRACCCPTHRV